ncbi:MAG TPA: DUF1427 family protein [Candidatus Absconditabacterales bacterium]|nr:DUF1427 family protein [Candidatus Absconditabacterales bacterium]HMT27111.1 DUF1427 family protein [Candidatus Absconditabacterales bacterium]
MNAQRFMDVLIALGTGMFVGALFTLLKLPLPAPGVFAGVVGIFGILLGGLLVNYFMGK